MCELTKFPPEAVMSEVFDTDFFSISPLNFQNLIFLKMRHRVPAIIYIQSAVGQKWREKRKTFMALVVVDTTDQPLEAGC